MAVPPRPLSLIDATLPCRSKIFTTFLGPPHLCRNQKYRKEDSNRDQDDHLCSDSSIPGIWRDGCWRTKSQDCMICAYEAWCKTMTLKELDRELEQGCPTPEPKARGLSIPCDRKARILVSSSLIVDRADLNASRALWSSL